MNKEAYSQFFSKNEDVVICLSTVILLLGFMLPYSIFTIFTPLYFLLLGVLWLSNIFNLSKAITVPKSVKEQRTNWKPQQKVLAIEPQTFIYKPVYFITLFGKIAVVAIICLLINIFYQAENNGDEALIVLSVIGVLIFSLFVWLGRLRPKVYEISANNDGLTLITKKSKSQVKWSEIILLQAFSVRGITSYTVHTSDGKFEYNHRFTKADNLTALIEEALEIEIEDS